MGKKRRKISIRTRILAMVLSLIAVIFLVVFAIFNLLVGEYIENSVHEQLQDAIHILHNEEQPPVLLPGEQSPPRQQPGTLPEMRMLPRGPMGKAETVIVSEDYRLLSPNESMAFARSYDEMNALVAQLKTDRVDLRTSEIMRLKVSDREYYFVAGKMPETAFGVASYLVYYIDMTDITSFAARINAVLLAVMCVAGLLAAGIAIFLSGKIAQPIRELTRFAVRIGKGDFGKNTATYRDVELAELAQSMNKAAAQLDAYDKEQKTFFQNVSHELRTPLQAIRCNAEGIEHGILEHQKSSRVIVEETDRLSEMVEDLLYLSRIDSITPGSSIEVWDLRELLSNCAERQRSLAVKRNIQFTFDFDDDPVNMPCDEKHMSRAFANLISNAIRYAGTAVTFACHQTADGIIITVADDGEGIVREDLPHIFDRFYKGRGGKHGIGLAIVKSIIERHKGHIEARNTDQGAVFTITFKTR